MKRRKHPSRKALQPLHWPEFWLKKQNPASATHEGMTPVIRLITFCLSGETRHRTDENMNDALVALANNVKKCFLQLKKSSDLKS